MGWALLMAGGLAVGVTGVLAISVWHVNGVAGPFIYREIGDVPARAVAIVPGVGTASRRMPRILRERLGPALELYKAGKVRAILVSGIGLGPKRDEVSTMVRWLQERGVPPEHIMSDPAGYRTFDTMRRAARLLNVESAIVCSQGVWLARATFLARAAGIDAVGFTARTSTRNSGYMLRHEAMKAVLAVADTYVLESRPRYEDMHGALTGQAGSTAVAQRPAFSFLTSPINAGTAVSQFATRP